MRIGRRVAQAALGAVISVTAVASHGALTQAFQRSGTCGLEVAAVGFGSGPFVMSGGPVGTLHISAQASFGLPVKGIHGGLSRGRFAVRHAVVPMTGAGHEPASCGSVFIRSARRLAVFRTREID